MFGGIGKALGAMDDRYAQGIREMVPSEEVMKKGFNMSHVAQPVAGFIGMDRNTPGINNMQRALTMGSRYALPAAGVTAAGIALMDLTSAFGGNADQPEQNQLGLNNGELSALGVVLASPLVAGGAGAGVDMFGLSGDGGLADAVNNPDKPGAIRRR